MCIVTYGHAGGAHVVDVTRACRLGLGATTAEGTGRVERTDNQTEQTEPEEPADGIQQTDRQTDSWQQT